MVPDNHCGVNIIEGMVVGVRTDIKRTRDPLPLSCSQIWPWLRASAVNGRGRNGGHRQVTQVTKMEDLTGVQRRAGLLENKIEPVNYKEWIYRYQPGLNLGCESRKD